MAVSIVEFGMPVIAVQENIFVLKNYFFRFWGGDVNRNRQNHTCANETPLSQTTIDFDLILCRIEHHQKHI